jgi:multisubunit Na+/H+ antiporter MnhB subunit
MPPFVQGALIGLGLGVFLLIFEYMMISKEVNERAKKYNRKPEFDVTERRRIATVRNFALLLPLAIGFVFWWVWG